MIPYFKVTENYDLTKACKVMRRDLRPGQATATAKALEDQRGVTLDVSFGAPFAGADFRKCRNVSVLSFPQVLLVQVCIASCTA
jgi:hypothetical protein